jgi:hypothetical protein
MPLVGFEPTTPVLERAKTVHALDRKDTVIGRCNNFHRRENLVYHICNNICVSALRSMMHKKLQITDMWSSFYFSVVTATSIFVTNKPDSLNRTRYVMQSNNQWNRFRRHMVRKSFNNPTVYYEACMCF